MVRGMALPKVFGLFWPDGEFRGWNRGLVAYYMAQPPEVQRALYDGYPDPVECAVSYPLYVSRKFISEIGSRKNARPENPPFTPIQVHESPKVFVTEAKCNDLGSLIMLNGRIIAVDEAMKSLIEQFEPGIHQFFPIEIMMPKEVGFPRTFFTLCIGNYFDSFVESASDSKAFDELPNSNGRLSINDSRQRISQSIKGLALAKDVHSGAHLWRERRFGEWLTCFSDDFHGAIQDAGLRVPIMQKMMEA